MSAAPAVAARDDARTWDGRELLVGSRWAAALRELLHRCLFLPALALFAGRLRVRGRRPSGPVVYVANHASHADTVAVRSAIGAARRRRLAVAAADDYFFTTPRRAGAITTAIGAFPFPRHGDLGLRRADGLLRDGWSVLLFPQGTRDPQAELRPGVLRLADAGWPIVPVGIAGTEHVLPKGARRPHRGRVAVALGPPLTREDVGGDLAVITTAITTAHGRAAQALRRRSGGNAGPASQRARALATRVSQWLRARADSRGAPRALATRVSQWLRARADSRGAPLLLFAWAFAEALVWPIIPDASLGILALARPRRWWVLALAAAAGSAAGGAVGWWAASQGWSWPLPLTTPRMHSAVAAWLGQGAAGIAHQPLSGVPYKVFVAAAPDAGLGLGELVGATLRYRGLRFAITAALGAVAGVVLWHLPPRWRSPVHTVISIAAVAALLVGLAVVVRAWS